MRVDIAQVDGEKKKKRRLKMGRQITLYDLINKLDICIEHNHDLVRRADLVKVYMLDDMHPWICSQSTFNEKIRVMCDVGFLKKIKTELYRIDWDFVDQKLAEWRPANV